MNKPKSTRTKAIAVQPNDDDDLPRGERAYRYIRQALATQKLMPGDRLREVDLAEMIGLSRTPIREALARLESEGLVVHDATLGIMVAELDYNMITELYFMREVLEGTAAKLAAQHASDVEISLLEDMCAQYADSVGNDQQLARSNRQFHELLYNCSHNRYLIKMLKTLHDTLTLLGNTTLTDQKRVKDTIKEHEAVVSAIKKHDPDTAEKALREHIYASQKMRIRRLIVSK
ncbi:GntR family transcriptional regulator [Zwartia sp.]|uniref:GntR family transcriptional regulator n=1 Tax=Zwartia sp. TaxID=2978004 RepID=UPI002716E785|nr:GntR family transcriptional regulator [Zwartia sp.]MDO9025573.1 GntR family transcriptional regulator [Zwartia sp.]